MKTVWRLLIDEAEETLRWMVANKRIAIGWGEIGPLHGFRTKEDIEQKIRARNESHPVHEGKSPTNAQHGSNSLWDFCFEMKLGDLVIISARPSDNDKHRRLGVWEVVGEYEYALPEAAPLNYQHQRLAREIAMDQDDLWHRAGGKLAAGQINFRTLGRCAKTIE